MEDKQGGTADHYPSLQGVFPCDYRFRHKRHSERDAFFGRYARIAFLCAADGWTAVNVRFMREYRNGRESVHGQR